MAKIPTFEAGPLALHPTEIGVDAIAGTARRVGAFYNQQSTATDMLARTTEQLARETESLGSFKGGLISDTGRRVGSSISDAGDAAVKFLDHQQISSGAAAFTGLMQAKTQQWNDTVKNADPNDPSVAGKFLNESLEPDLTQFKSGFWTEGAQKWAEAHADAFRQHMAEKASADMSTMAGNAAIVNQRQTINGLSNTVRDDPSGLDFALGTLASATEGVIKSSPNLSPAEASRVRSEILQQGKESIVKSAAMGWIAKTGSVPSWATDPKYSPYINGGELKSFEQSAKMYRNMAASEARQQRQEQDYQAKNSFNRRMNDIEAATIPKNAGDKPTLPTDYWEQLRQTLRDNPQGAALEPGRFRTMVNNGEILTERMNKPEPLGPVSHETTMDLLTRMRAPVGSPNRIEDNGAIYEAYQKGKLNSGDFAFAMKEFDNMRTPEGQRLADMKHRFFQAVEPQIDKSVMGIPDPDGKERNYQFQFEVERRMGEMRKAGKDPYSLLDPTSPNYMGKPEALDQFRNPINKRIQDAMTAFGGVGATPAAASPAGVPAPLRGIAGLERSQKTGQYRDPMTGKRYDASGQEVK